MHVRFQPSTLTARTAVAGVPPASRPHRLMARMQTQLLAEQLDLAFEPNLQRQGHKAQGMGLDRMDHQPDQDLHLILLMT
jgi:hypothetical protein